MTPRSITTRAPRACRPASAWGTSCVEHQPQGQQRAVTAFLFRPALCLRLLARLTLEILQVEQSEGPVEQVRLDRLAMLTNGPRRGRAAALTMSPRPLALAPAVLRLSRLGQAPDVPRPPPRATRAQSASRVGIHFEKQRPPLRRGRPTAPRSEAGGQSATRGAWPDKTSSMRVHNSGHMSGLPRLSSVRLRGDSVVGQGHDSGWTRYSATMPIRLWHDPCLWNQLIVLLNVCTKTRDC